MKINDKNLIWIDLEMTGLNPEIDKIIEIATLVTDSNLNILAEGPVLAIYQSDEQLSLMNNWNITTHTRSGLIKRVKNSNIDEKIATKITIKFLSEWVSSGKSPICGSTVAQDRRFLFKYMPKLEEYFHYHYIDVGTIRELAKRWRPDIINKFEKKNKHQALEDIKSAIVELSYYRDNFIKII